MASTVVKAVGIGKRYKLGERESYTALRDIVAGWGRALLRLDGGAQARKARRSSIWSLRDISFDIEDGDTVGIIGRNGAGKSTLLKVLARITRPTLGTVELRGRVGSLLEVGTGFHPELTGRDNVYLSGAILGMKRAEIRERFDDIVAFAEIEEFLDTPVKRYSSGMYMRLAFSVAAHLEPEILLVDEVLAVGDVAFQKKCLGKMGEVAKSGRTILFVSHNMGAVTAVCRRALFINQGQLVADGKSQDVVTEYLQAVRTGTLPATARGDEALVLESATLRNARNEATDQFAPGDELRIEISYRAQRRLDRPCFWVAILNSYGQGLLIASMLFDNQAPDFIEGDGKLFCTFKSLPLLPQSYSVMVGVRAENGQSLLAHSRDLAYFMVTGRLADCGLDGPNGDVVAADFPWMVVPYEWHAPDTGKGPVQVAMKFPRRAGLVAIP